MDKQTWTKQGGQNVNKNGQTKMVNEKWTNRNGQKKVDK